MYCLALPLCVSVALWISDDGEKKSKHKCERRGTDPTGVKKGDVRGVTNANQCLMSKLGGEQNRQAGCTCAVHSIKKSLPTYKYSILNGKQAIRLLRLLPGSTLAFELFPFDIHKAPPYLALSYTWGSHTSHDAITVDGQSITIPKNLADAMKSMRDYVKKKRLMLWADSVCVNQGDVQERSHQIGLMHSIYRCAECVGIWLGKSANESDLVMDKMTEWKCEFDRLCEPFEDNWELATTSISASNTTFYGPEGSTQYGAWRAFQILIQRAWWRRAWIVQEATALGPFRTLLFCGNRMVNWSTLRAALYISHHVAHVETQGMSLTFVQGMAAIRLDQFRYNRERGAYIRLFTVLELIRPFECQDPRDKLYASLGLAADLLETDIGPDYTKSVKDVYTDIARFSLSQSESYCLDFLGLVVQCPEELGGTLYDPGLQIIQRGFNIELNAKTQSIQLTESSRSWQRI